MKVGEYCRNKYGIAKVIDIENNNGIDILVFDKPICFLVNKETGKIKDDRLSNRLAIIDGVDVSKIKSSPNIIDLIEVGDYVNGEYVIGFGKFEYDDGTEERTSLTLDKNCQCLQKDIKSIVTKEMYSSVEYRVEIN